MQGAEAYRNVAVGNCRQLAAAAALLLQPSAAVLTICKERPPGIARTEPPWRPKGGGHHCGRWQPQPCTHQIACLQAPLQPPAGMPHCSRWRLRPRSHVTAATAATAPAAEAAAARASTVALRAVSGLPRPGIQPASQLSGSMVMAVKRR